MILKIFRIGGDENTAVEELPEPDMVVDPRPSCLENFKFKVSVNGTAMKVTRIVREGDPAPGWWAEIIFKVYKRNEFHYSFESTKYLLHGLKGERAPYGTTEVVVKDGVKTMTAGAFFDCMRSLSTVIIPNTVTRIECRTFFDCVALKFIHLPPNLQFIGHNAFRRCFSLQSIYIPSTVTSIGQNAFKSCTSLRILYIPNNVQLQDDIIENCTDLLAGEIEEASYKEQIQWFRGRFNAFHNLCGDPDVTAEDIQGYIHEHPQHNVERARTKDKPQFTALHLLAANPNVTAELITAYLQLAPDVAVIQDNNGETPLHMLCSAQYISKEAAVAIRAYCSDKNGEGKKAAFMRDCRGRTPFECLCEKSLDDLLFLGNRSFRDLMIWWYECVDINLFSKDNFLRH